MFIRHRSAGGFHRIAASAQQMPANIKTELQKLVGKWNMETVIDGETTESELEVKWAADESVLIFYWAGTDFDTVKKNSGTGLLDGTLRSSWSWSTNRNDAVTGPGIRAYPRDDELTGSDDQRHGSFQWTHA